jgi:hypothetical protein
MTQLFLKTQNHFKCEPLLLPKSGIKFWWQYFSPFSTLLMLYITNGPTIDVLLL